MAHSHERTLLASLGFSDPDKRDRRHTLACQYLCREDVALKLAGVLGVEDRPAPSLEPLAFSGPDKVEYVFDSWEHGLRLYEAVVEKPLVKSHGYLVGFLDVYLQFARTCTTVKAKVERDSLWRIRGSDAWGNRSSSLSVWTGDVPREVVEHRNVYTYLFVPHSFNVHAATVAIEVKVKPTDVGEMARQMALYSVHLGPDCIKVIAACWRMSADDRATLRDKGIRTIFLGEPFEAYCRARDAEGADSEMQEF